jgi:hypothetical protein
MARTSSVSNGRIIKATITIKMQRDIRGPKGWYWPSARCGAEADAVRAEKRACRIQDRCSSECDGIRDSKVNFKDVSRCLVRDGGLDIKADKIIKGRVQITGAFKGKGVKYVGRVFVMRMIMCQFPSVSGLCSSRVGCTSLRTKGGCDEVHKIRAMRSIFKRDNEVRAEAGGTLLGGSIDNIRSSRLERIPLVDVRGGLSYGVCLLKIYVKDRGVVSKSTGNPIETVPRQGTAAPLSHYYNQQKK